MLTLKVPDSQRRFGIIGQHYSLHRFGSTDAEAFRFSADPEKRELSSFEAYQLYKKMSTAVRFTVVRIEVDEAGAEVSVGAVTRPEHVYAAIWPRTCGYLFDFKWVHPDDAYKVAAVAAAATLIEAVS